MIFPPTDITMPSATHVASRPIISARDIGSVRPLKVIYIGAGISGILAAIRLPAQVQNLDLVIYDKNEELGGTWFENKYPGCACGIYSLPCVDDVVQSSALMHLLQIFRRIATNCLSNRIPLGVRFMPRLLRFWSTGSEWRTSIRSGNI